MGPIWVRVARLFYETVGVSFHLETQHDGWADTQGTPDGGLGVSAPAGLVQQGYSPVSLLERQKRNPGMPSAQPAA